MQTALCYFIVFSHIFKFRVVQFDYIICNISDSCLTNESDTVSMLQSYQKALKADPSYKLAAECLAIVLTDLGTSLKLAGNTDEGIQKYFDALKVDGHYAVKS